MALSIILPAFDLRALQDALAAALPGKINGLKDFGDGITPMDVLFNGVKVTLSPADETTAQGIASAHDPVFLAVDKTVILANDTDVFTVTVTAPKPGAAPVSLAVSINGNAPSVVPVALSGGVGAVQFTSKDQCVITVSVQNPSNRSASVISVRAE